VGRESGKQIGDLTPYGSVTSALQPDGKRIVTASRTKDALWTPRAASRRRALTAHLLLWRARRSADGKADLTASGTHGALWDARAAADRQAVHGHTLLSERSVHRRPGIVTASEDNTARLWTRSASRSAPLTAYECCVERASPTQRISPRLRTHRMRCGTESGSRSAALTGHRWCD